jgi:hypothetical protein
MRQLANLKYTPAVRFHPFVGEAYGSAPFYSGRLLIVGESHHDDWDSPPTESDWTIEAVRQGMEEGGRSRLWDQVPQAVTGEGHSVRTMRDFWNSVAFYNYVQRAMLWKGKTGAIRESPPMSEAIRYQGAYLEVLRDLNPTLVLAFSSTLWDAFPTPTAETYTVGDDTVEVAWDPTTGTATCPRIRLTHPTYWRYEGGATLARHPRIAYALKRWARPTAPDCAS